MVWRLIPAETLRGAQKYYILARGTYKVGRKGCDIIVQMDAAVSRIHAEVIVDKMISQDTCCSGPTSSNSYVRIRDSSKYGTFINKELGPKAVRLRHGEEATLKEGDIVTFGTGNASFRFCFVPLRIFIHGSMVGHVRSSLQDTASSIGATVASKWSPECTHALVNESSPVTVELIEAVMEKKLVVFTDWFKVLSEKNICTELPSCTSYEPSLNLEGNLVRIVDPKRRENFLKGYTFVLGSSHTYKFHDKLRLLLEITGARSVGADEFLSDSQISADRENNRVVLVNPAGSTTEFNHSREFSSLSRITDIDLVAAVLSGHLDSAVVELPSIIISSSHSTDETIVADSDVEIDTAASTHAVKTEPVKGNYGGDDVPHKHGGEEDTKKNGVDEIVNLSISPESKTSVHTDSDAILINKLDKSDVSHLDRHENSDIIYSQDLLVRNTTTPVQVMSSIKKVVNFKCFRKRRTMSGNSFRDLIPFSKDPYKEADYGKEESDYMRDERKRKHIEAIAEDLFNSEKMRKRAASGTSLEAFLARR